MQIILIFLGGGTGSLLRYFLNNFIRGHVAGGFPLGILAVNVLGSLLIGLAAGAIKNNGSLAGLSGDNATALFMVGILGGFTTFSAFSLDVVRLINEGSAAQAAIYVIASVALSIAAAFAGYFITQ